MTLRPNAKVNYNYLRFFEYVHIVGLIILPKCSLCLFAISSSITFCGVQNATTPLWEYLVILIMAIFPVFKSICGCSISKPQLLLIITGGLFVLFYAFSSEVEMWKYYLGMAFIFSGYAWTPVNKFIRKFSNKPNGCLHAPE